MAVRIIIRPTPVKATSKERLLDKIMLRDIYSFENRFNSSGYFLFGRIGGKYEGVIRLYAMEKHNRKVKVEQRTITRGKNKGQVEKTRTVVREAGWVGHYYDVPIDLVDMKATRQFGRHFYLRLKDGTTVGSPFNYA